VLAVRKAITLSVVALSVLAMYVPGWANQTWKIFSNRAGWSISYPADWNIGSCRSCKDPTAPEVFVDFFLSAKIESDGWVMVEHLASKPSDISADGWLADTAKKANLNPRLSEERITLDGSPALKVRYRTATGEETEAVYVVAGLETFEIHFSGQAPGVPLEKLANYATYLKMLGTFRGQRPSLLKHPHFTHRPGKEPNTYCHPPRAGA
jgi:hypothetical protein